MLIKPNHLLAMLQALMRMFLAFKLSGSSSLRGLTVEEPAQGRPLGKGQPSTKLCRASTTGGCSSK